MLPPATTRSTAVNLLAGGLVAVALIMNARRRSRRLFLFCSMCSQMKPSTAFTARQCKRRDAVRKCERCVATFVPQSEAARRAERAKRQRTPAADKLLPPMPPSTPAPLFDSAEDPLRLARKAETVLRGRTDHIALVLENCCDDLNHVAVLRTCEVRPSASLTDEQTHAHASH